MIESPVAKLAVLMKNGGKITSKKGEIIKLLSSVTKSQNYRSPNSAPAHQWKIEIQFLWERKKTLNGNLASVKKALASI